MPLWCCLQVKPFMLVFSRKKNHLKNFSFSESDFTAIISASTWPSDHYWVSLMKNHTLGYRIIIPGQLFNFDKFFSWEDFIFSKIIVILNFSKIKGTALVFWYVNLLVTNKMSTLDQNAVNLQIEISISTQFLKQIKKLYDIF